MAKKKQGNKQNAHKFTLRTNESLINEAKETAIEYGMSLNKFIERAIKDKLNTPSIIKMK